MFVLHEQKIDQADYWYVICKAPEPQHPPDGGMWWLRGDVVTQLAKATW
jgi:hypothetical protein